MLSFKRYFLLSEIATKIAILENTPSISQAHEKDILEYINILFSEKYPGWKNLDYNSLTLQNLSFVKSELDDLLNE